MQSITTCLRKSFDFSGRATRAEFWWPYFFYCLAAFALSMLGMEPKIDGTTSEKMHAGIELGLLLPLAAVAWRRMHDIGMSGRWNILTMVPGLPGLVLLASDYWRPTAPPDPFASVASIMAEMDRTSFIINAVTYAMVTLFVVTWTAFAYFWSRPSIPGPNSYGPNPREVSP
jgi:uncharacterized membrane protein YhaH (DUF805 family)